MNESVMQQPAMMSRKDADRRPARRAGRSSAFYGYLTLTILIAIGVLFAFAGLLAMWLIPDATLGKGPKVMMILFILSLVGFFVWLYFFLPIPPGG